MNGGTALHTWGDGVRMLRGIYGLSTVELAAQAGTTRAVTDDFD